jgi:hypothetical protein
MSKILGPSVGYVDLLNHATTEMLKKEKADGKDFQKSPIRPSAAGACTRELFYQLMQYSGRAKYQTEIHEPETHRLLNLGHSIESHIVRQFELLSEFFEIRYKQQVLSFSYLEAKNDKKLSQWLEGSLDLVFWSEKFKCVADIKSKKDKFSSFHRTNWDEMTGKLSNMKSVEIIEGLDPSKPNVAFWVENLDDFLKELNDPFFEANFLQLNLYANSDFLKERGVNHGAIIQYCKNDSRLREIRFKPSKALYDKTVKKFQNVITAVDEGKPEIATKDYVLGSIKCAFCKFSSECWGEKVDAKKEHWKSYPAKQWPKDTAKMGVTGKDLEALFHAFTDKEKAVKEKEVIERDIVKLLLESDVEKVRTEKGDIYEVRRLKDSIVLRRGKL